MTITRLALRRVRRALDAALVATVLVAALSLALARVPTLFGATTFVIAGPSMGSSAPIGAAVVAVPVRAEDLAVGDIVSMKLGAEQALFTHRIVRIATREGAIWIETKGDANVEPDPAIVPASAIVGRAAAIVPYAGFAVALLSTASGLAFVVGLAAMLAVAAWLVEAIEADALEPRLEPQVGSTDAGTATTASG